MCWINFSISILWFVILYHYCSSLMSWCFFAFCEILSLIIVVFISQILFIFRTQGNWHRAGCRFGYFAEISKNYRKWQVNIVLLLFIQRIKTPKIKVVFEEIFLIPLILKIRKKAAGLVELQSYQIVSILIFSLARELCFTGRRFTAEEALQFGFVRFVLWCCDTSYKLSTKSNASVSLKLQLHPWQSLGIWTFEDGLFKFALLWAKTVFKCLNKC